MGIRGFSRVRAKLNLWGSYWVDRVESSEDWRENRILSKLVCFHCPSIRPTIIHLRVTEIRTKLSLTMATPASRSKALSLYRKLMRGAMKMPTPNRQNFVIRKTRTEFKAAMGLTDPEEINEAIRLADTNLDTVLVQAEHLTKLMQDPKYDDVWRRGLFWRAVATHVSHRTRVLLPFDYCGSYETVGGHTKCFMIRSWQGDR